jgi:YihY family inner membrane protein
MRTWFQKARQSNGWHTLHRTWQRWSEEDGDQRAAAFGFYLLLSILPLVILLVTAGSLFFEREVATEAIVRWANDYSALTAEQESSAIETIRGVLEARGTVSLAALPLLLWSALNFLRALIRSTNRIWHAATYNWWQLPLKSLGLLGITASAVLVGILLPLVARLAQSWLTTGLKLPDALFALLFHLIPWIVLFYGLLMIYRLAPSRRTTFAEVWIGALAATILIGIGQTLFLVYLDNFARFNVLYGTLGGIMAFLLWLYLSSAVGVLGVCYCAARAEVQGGSDRGVISRRGTGTP